jgi:SRSO17 transposase
VSFVNSYTHHFRSYRHDVSEKARQYAKGLMQADRSKKNMERMAEAVPDSDPRNLQQFLTHSKWSAREVIDHVARDANELLGDPSEAALLIDESGFGKQGKMSVGVARQWFGRLGKVENCQVAVFGVLANGDRAVPVDERLYLPEEWTDDPERCAKAGVPETDRKFKTKKELAAGIVRDASDKGLEFGWVGADSGYGKGLGFCKAVDDLGKRFVVDVHRDFRVWLEDPRPRVPEKKGGPGPKFTRYRTDAEAVKVEDLVAEHDLGNRPVLELRDSSRGPLKARALCLPVYVWDGESPKAERWLLVATRTIGSNPDTKMSVSNAPESVGLERLAWMQRQRYWVERAFEDAKGECGMADYQVRKWNGFHHHMALVMMAMLFMLSERMRNADEIPLLSCADIERLLSRFLPRRDVTRDEVLRQMEERHRRRQAATESHSRRNGKHMNHDPTP